MADQTDEKYRKYLVDVPDEIVDVENNNLIGLMGKWETCAQSMGLSAQDITDINANSDPSKKRKAALSRYQEKQGLDATYQNLIKACVDSGCKGTAAKIMDLAQSKTKAVPDGGEIAAAADLPATEIVEDKSVKQKRSKKGDEGKSASLPAAISEEDCELFKRNGLGDALDPTLAVDKYSKLSVREPTVANIKPRQRPDQTLFKRSRSRLVRSGSGKSSAVMKEDEGVKVSGKIEENKGNVEIEYTVEFISPDKEFCYFEEELSKHLLRDVIHKDDGKSFADESLISDADKYSMERIGEETKKVHLYLSVTDTRIVEERKINVAKSLHKYVKDEKAIYYVDRIDMGKVDTGRAKRRWRKAIQKVSARAQGNAGATGTLTRESVSEPLEAADEEVAVEWYGKPVHILCHPGPLKNILEGVLDLYFLGEKTFYIKCMSHTSVLYLKAKNEDLVAVEDKDEASLFYIYEEENHCLRISLAVRKNPRFVYPEKIPRKDVKPVKMSYRTDGEFNLRREKEKGAVSNWKSGNQQYRIKQKGDNAFLCVDENAVVHRHTGSMKKGLQLTQSNFELENTEFERYFICSQKTT